MSLKLPNLIVIGGAKCGTTSLHYYLSLHPEISMSQPKELNFFVEEENWPKGLAWYASHFEDATTRVRGESSPHYTRYPVIRGVVARMHALIPDAKLIYILRDPMERLISQYVDDSSAFTSGAVPDPWALLWPPERSPFVAPSLQCLQLEQYLSCYDESQVLLLTAADLGRQRAATMRKVFRFLEVDESFSSEKFSIEHNPRAIKRQPTRAHLMVKRFLRIRPGRLLPECLGLFAHHWILKASAPPVVAPTFAPDLEARLLEVFHKDAERLRRVTGMKLADWKV